MADLAVSKSLEHNRRLNPSGTELWRRANAMIDVAFENRGLLGN